MATALEPTSDELVSMVFSAPIHLCPVLYPNRKDEEKHEEEVHSEEIHHHHHHEHTKLEEHNHHHIKEVIAEEPEEEHVHHHEEHHIARSQSPLSNCTSVSEPSAYPEEEHHHHEEIHENVVHVSHHHEEHVSEEHSYVEQVHFEHVEHVHEHVEHVHEHVEHVHEHEEKHVVHHHHELVEPDVPEPEHEPEVHAEEDHEVETIEDHFTRPAGGFMLEVEHHSVISGGDDDGSVTQMSYEVHERHSISEDIIPAKSEEHDRVIRELKAQQNHVVPDADAYKVTCWHDTVASDDGAAEYDYEPAQFVEPEKAESVREHPVVNPRTFVHHVEEHPVEVEEQFHHEEQHHHHHHHHHAEEEHHHHRDHHEEEHHHHHDHHHEEEHQVPISVTRAPRTISTLSEDLPFNEDAQREVCSAPGVRSLLNRFESGNPIHDEPEELNESRRSSLQTSVYEGRAREILQEVLGLSDDESQLNEFVQHKRTQSVHKIDQESLPSAVSSRRSSVNTSQKSTVTPKPTYIPPEQGVTTPRSAKFNPEKFQSVRVVKSVRDQVRIWGGQEIKPRHYSRRVSRVTNIGTVFEEPSKKPALEQISEKRDSVFSSVSQPSKHSRRAPSSGQVSKRSSVASVVSNGSTLVSHQTSRRTSVASSATLTNASETKKVAAEKYEYKAPSSKVEPASASSTISYRHHAAAKVPVSQRKSLFESESVAAPKRNFVVVRKTTSVESSEGQSTVTKKTGSGIGDWKKQIEATF